MTGYLWRAEPERHPPGTMAEWESVVVDAVGHVIEFWGFKRNQGRVWALLYLRGAALSAQELIDTLALSKGAVSMLTRELEQWGVIERVREAGQGVWRFVAVTDLMQMIGRVVREREAGMIARVRQDLEEAEAMARDDPRASPEELSRLGRMRTLAKLVERALTLFLDTARLDVKPAFEALREDPGPHRPKGGRQKGR